MIYDPSASAKVGWGNLPQVKLALDGPADDALRAGGVVQCQGAMRADELRAYWTEGLMMTLMKGGFFIARAV